MEPNINDEKPIERNQNVIEMAQQTFSSILGIYSTLLDFVHFRSPHRAALLLGRPMPLAAYIAI